jgi:hypothetical protein
MKNLSNQKRMGVVICLTLSFYFSCDKSDEIENFELNPSKNILNTSYSKAFNYNGIPDELTNFLGPGDQFEIVNYEDLDSVLVFSSVHDFINYKNDSFLYMDTEVINNGNGIHSTRYREILNEMASINIIVNQKLDDEDANQSYAVKNIMSVLYGKTKGKSWFQESYNYLLFNGTSIIDLFGKIRYRILIDDLGIEFTDARHYKIINDIHTGFPLNILDADD